jgi:RND family efflux transporter MFP subunit
MNRGRRLPQLARHPAGPPAAATDAHLLGRWTAGRDETAFELLVRRHGPMVLAVCRRALADPNDADDAFQATFLVLARKAGSVARGDVLAAWLHRVASRAASRVRADRLRRTGREEPGVETLPGPPEPDPGWAELARVLDEEVGRLPARHRAAFVLCCLEGKTGEEAARVLGCPAGTVSSRLTRARERLRDRLARRGFAPAALALAAGAERASAAPAPALIDSTLRAALAFAAGWPSPTPPARPAVVAEGVIRAMILNKLRLAPALLAAGLLAAGAVFAGSNPGSAPADPPGNAKTDPPKVKTDGGAPDLPVVHVVRPQKGGLDRVSRQTCTAEPVQRVDLFAGVAGVIQHVNVDIGDRVKAGQLLATIDAPDLVLDFKQAEVGIEQAEGSINEARARVTAAKAEIVAAEILVKQRQAEETSAKAMLTFREKQHARMKDLVNQKAVDQTVLAEHEAQLLAAQAQGQAAAAAVENVRAELQIRKGKLTQAEAANTTALANYKAALLVRDKARLALAPAGIKSPIDGVITHRSRAAGEFVRPGDPGAKPLLTVVRVDVVRVVVGMPEWDAPLTEPGLPVEVEFPSMPGTKFAGKVARIGFALEGPKHSREMRAEIDLPNPDGKIRPGMGGWAVVQLGKGPPESLRIPVSALFAVTNPATNTYVVYVYRGNGKARATQVRVNHQNGDTAEIGSGLTADDQVVLDPAQLRRDARDEIPVRVAPPK